MEEIRAFVGHSFASDDAEVVGCFLKYFSQLSNSHPNFSWEHAEAAEPKVVAEKVMSLIADKNVFIGICTKKECVVQPDLLRTRFLNPRQFLIQKDQIYWKTSDWIIQEIGLAKGRNLDIILLIESDVRLPSGLQSDLEYILFDRAAPEKSFGKILEMITALSPKSPSNAAIVTSAQSVQYDEQDTPELQKNDELKTPKPEWTRKRYESAFFYMNFLGDNASAENINRAYLDTTDASQDDNKYVWEAYCEFTRLTLGRGGTLENLKALAEKYPHSSGVLKYLALGFEEYKDYADAARVYEEAATKTQNEVEQLQLLTKAAAAHAQAGAAAATAKVIDQMKSQVQTSGVGEEELLNALKGVAEIGKQEEELLAIMERIVDLDPSDTRIRFSLAYKHAEVGNNDLALFHYLRIPYNEREPVAWNNLGVVFDHFDLSAKSVEAYRKAEAAGETLAMSNLAQKLITAGFLPEAQKQCDAALQIGNYHKNIPHTMARLKSRPGEEEKKEAELLEKAKPIRDFYAEYGRALLRTEPHDLEKRWKAPNYSLEATLQGSAFEARGSYELPPGSLAYVALEPFVKRSPIRYHVEYHGILRGCAIEGSVIREREDERQKVKSILGGNENEARILMVVSDNGNEIQVMEAL
jgi:hypothetical protein